MIYGILHSMEEKSGNKYWEYFKGNKEEKAKQFIKDVIYEP